MKAAVIGIGSNSIRMLQAEVSGDRYRRIELDREPTRLFSGLDAEGNLTRESMEKTTGVVGRFAEKARGRGCESVFVFATSASRDARNGSVFLELLRQSAGVEPEIISGEEEGMLSFLGASQVVPGTPRCGVVDIGGGSTELVAGQGMRIEKSVSCQMGAVRLFQEFPIRNGADMTAVEEEAIRILAEKLKIGDGPSPWKPVPETWVGTGGTFTVLGAMVRGVAWTDRTNMHGTRIGRERAREIGRMLAGMTMEERLKLHSLQPARADIVVHGICILLGIMDYLKIPEIIVSECGNLDGYIRKNCLNGMKS